MGCFGICLLNCHQEKIKIMLLLCLYFLSALSIFDEAAVALQVYFFMSLSLSLLQYISTRVWVLRTPNIGRISHFLRFLCKKAKKARNLKQNFAKNTFFSLSQFFPLFSFSCTNCHSTFFCSNYLSVGVFNFQNLFSFFCGLYSVVVF